MAKKEDSGEEQKSKGGLLKLIIIAVVVIILGVGGFFGWSMFIKKDSKKEQTKDGAPLEVEIKQPVTYKLDTFIVNLRSNTGAVKKYLKVGVILEINNVLHKKVLDQKKPQVRDSILILLSSKTFKEISSVDGKIELKQSLMLRINQIAGQTIVGNIFFTEFVVQ